MEKTLQFVLKNRLLVGILSVLVLAGGIYSFFKLPVDAFPDVTPKLVQVFTETKGLAPEEIERYVSYPIETAMAGIPGLREIRSISNFGLSVVNIYFHDDTEIYFARQLVNERLQRAREEIPAGFGDPEMGPISTGLGQILFFVLEDETGTRTPQQMREIQDWLIKYNLQTVPGVTEVLSLGGEVRQFQVLMRPHDLLQYDLTLEDVVKAIKANNSNVGAEFIVKNSEEYVVRSVGLAEKIVDLETVLLKSRKGTPVFLRQVARIETGGELRRGLATMNGAGEVVVGMVLKLIGTNTSTVIAGVKEKMDAVNKVLPPGVKVVVYYDQATLVKKCIQTVGKALAEAVVLIVIIQLVMLGGFRPSIVVLAAIPFSLAFSFIFMRYFDISANLMSLGGIAIALGLLVDGAVVMVENIDRRMKESAPAEFIRVILDSSLEVMRPIIFSLLIIIIVFLPLFTLQGVEGKTFRPLAQTMSLAMLGSLCFAVFFVPVLASLVMKRPSAEKGDHKEVRIMTWLLSRYRPAVTYFVHQPKKAACVGGVLMIIGLALFAMLGSEFVPRLNEGDLLVRSTMAPSISLEEARDTMLRFEKRMKAKFPEVKRVVTRVGRGEIGAHADPVNSAESFVEMMPKDQWTSARSLEELYAKMSEAFKDFPGVQFTFTQPIAAAVDELLTGIKADLAIKIFGPDIEELKRRAEEIEAVIRSVPGAADVQKDQITGAPQLRITVNRTALARYGINVADVQETLKTAVGGQKAGQVFEGVRRFDILVRFAAEARGSAGAIGNILIASPSGAKVPLSQLAAIEEIVGPRQITRENNQRFITVQCNVRNRDIGSFVKDAQQAIDAKVKLPPGYLTTWGGQYQLQQEANKKLALVVPVTLLIVFILLYMSFGSLKNTLLILLNVPLALVGGIIALWVSGQNLSVPASVGFIALFGIALANGMVLVTCLNQLFRSGVPMNDTCIEGACLRLRPVLMTALAAALGLVPMVFSGDTGSEVQRPLATVVIGGLVTSTALTLLLIPAFYRWFAINPDEETVMK
jgi:cobalt-zinc-cadmium resistance protein CzcA